MKRKEEERKERRERGRKEKKKEKEGRRQGRREGKEGGREEEKGRKEGAGKSRPRRRLTLLILSLNAYPLLGQTKEGQVVTWVVTRVGYFKNIQSAQQLS